MKRAAGIGIGKIGALALVVALCAMPALAQSSLYLELSSPKSVSCTVTGSAKASISHRRFLGTERYELAGDLASTAIVCTLADGRRMMSRAHLEVLAPGRDVRSVALTLTRQPETREARFLAVYYSDNRSWEIRDRVTFAWVK